MKTEGALILGICLTIVGGLAAGVALAKLDLWWQGRRARQRALKRGGYIR